MNGKLFEVSVELTMDVNTGTMTASKASMNAIEIDNKIKSSNYTQWPILKFTIINAEDGGATGEATMAQIIHWFNVNIDGQGTIIKNAILTSGGGFIIDDEGNLISPDGGGGE